MRVAFIQGYVFSILSGLYLQEVETREIVSYVKLISS